MNDIKDQMVPPQEEGAESNTEHSATLPNENEAKKFFDQVKQRLLNVNGWHALGGAGTATFQLTDEKGNEVHRFAKEGDHFRIDIPGPGPATGEGYDWVRVERIEEKQVPGSNEACLVMSVRPATNPKGGGNDVAHFFSEQATSNFMVCLEGNTVKAEVHGRNEKPNTNAEKAVDKARNTMVALSAMAGISKLQWKSLVKGLVQSNS